MHTIIYCQFHLVIVKKKTSSYQILNLKSTMVGEDKS